MNGQVAYVNLTYIHFFEGLLNSLGFPLSEIPNVNIYQLQLLQSSFSSRLSRTAHIFDMENKF